MTEAESSADDPHYRYTLSLKVVPLAARDACYDVQATSRYASADQLSDQFCLDLRHLLPGLPKPPGVSRLLQHLGGPDPVLAVILELNNLLTRAELVRCLYFGFRTCSLGLPDSVLKFMEAYRRPVASKTAVEATAPEVPAVPVEIESLEAVEREHILATLDLLQWNKTQVSAVLGIERSTLDRKLKKYNVTRPANNQSSSVASSVVRTPQPVTP